MAPHSTFLRRLGFLGSFRLLILLRTRLRYFISVPFSSWKICGVRQGTEGGEVEGCSLGYHMAGSSPPWALEGEAQFGMWGGKQPHRLAPSDSHSWGCTREEEGKALWGWSWSWGAARRPPSLELGVNGGGTVMNRGWQETWVPTAGSQKKPWLGVGFIAPGMKADP